MKRRVLIFHPALAPYRVDMFNALARECELRVVFLLANTHFQDFDQKLLRSQLRFETGDLLGGVAIGRRKRTIRFGFAAEIARHRPHVVVTTEFGQAAAAVIAHRALGRAEYAWVAATEDNPFTVEQDTLLHRLGRRAFLPQADCVLTYSEEARALYRGRFSACQPVAASALVQEEAVIRARLAAAAATARAEAEARGLLGRKVLLYVGRLAPEKRVDRLVDAALRLQRAAPDLVLALVGDGPEREALLARAGQAARDGRIVFTGRLEGDALSAWYRLGAVFALASSHEPFGAVVNEALLAGMPAVVSDRAGVRVLVESGRNGDVVDAGDPAALDLALSRRLAAAPPLAAEALGRERPSVMTTTFAAAVEAYLGALEAAIAHRSGRRGGAAGRTA